MTTVARLRHHFPMGDIYALLVLANIILIIAGLFDCITSDDRQVRSMPKLLWVLVILLLQGVGAILWFVIGRPIVDPRANHPAGKGRVVPEDTDEDVWSPEAPAPSTLPRQLAPDDDPEFLRSLADRTRRADEERLREWEADLHRREQRLRDKEDPPADK
ncbi:MAG TPA: PLDc N-terminal domain-containing protein [Micromonosporaceae bacterium]|nr:PLDc N-terminal domain-containing protein [Micromonosporaceae bacterium]